MPAANRFTALLDPLALRVARSPLPGWTREAGRVLRSLLPPRWRALIDDGDQQLCLRLQGGDVELIVSDRNGERLLGTLPLDDVDVLDTVRLQLDEGGVARWLLLPASQVLRRVLPLPAAAEPRLREVLAFELDRQTPFSVDQVTFQGRVLGRDLAAQQLQVELLVLPRHLLEAALQALGPLAPGLAGVDAVDADGRRLGLNLLPDSHRDQRRDPVRRLNAALAAIGLVCLLGAAALILGNRSDRLAEFKTLVADATTEARQARILRNQLQISANAANFLATTRATRPTMLELLADLSQRIPDDTSLDKLAINGDKLVIVGQSRAAPALVALLQASPLLRDPALSGAVQADPRSGRDRFTLTATVIAAPSVPSVPSVGVPPDEPELAP
jgi:general secretion pathway protein L